MTIRFGGGHAPDSGTTNDIQCLGPIVPLKDTDLMKTINEMFRIIDSSCAEFSSSPFNGIYTSYFGYEKNGQTSISK